MLIFYSEKLETEFSIQRRVFSKSMSKYILKLKIWVPYKLTNSVALVRERTIPTERPPPVGEVSANFCG